MDATAAHAGRRRVGAWLFAVTAMVFVMVVLGGATRLTGSGLSIMEWAPFRGTLPPLSAAEWDRLYRLYQQIPQYELVNKGFGLDGFKEIFWLEWTHRLWGRLIGLAFAVPLLVLWWRGAVTRPMLPRLGLLLVLGGLQGAVGWFMVASGFAADSTTVSPYRLVAHLVMALGLYVALLWTALGAWSGSWPRATPQAVAGSRVLPIPVPAWLRRMALGCCVLVMLTMVAGGFVAGTRAGLTYNTFPLMDGRLVPEGYAQLQPWWRNLTENLAAVQFDHRVLATASALLLLATAVLGLRARLPGAVRASLMGMGAAVAAQYALGVATLLWVVPPVLGTLHQAAAFLVLSAVLVTLHAARTAR